MTNTMPENLNELIPFAKLIGLEFTHAEQDKVCARMEVTKKICNPTMSLHGGAMMSMADSMGAIGAYLNKDDPTGLNVTLESKTNFVKAAKLGSVVYAQCEPLHRGRRTSIWSTKIKRQEDDALVAVITQTQFSA